MYSCMESSWKMVREAHEIFLKMERWQNNFKAEECIQSLLIRIGVYQKFRPIMLVIDDVQ